MSELLAPTAIQPFRDNNGQSLVGGQLFTYAAGTTTKLATFTDSTGGTPNTNPIVLNSRGECAIWIPPGVAYKFVLAPSTDTDPPTSPIWTADNITVGLALIPGGTDTGSANAYVVTGVNGITALTANIAIVVKITHNNSGASTLNVNSLGIKNILDQFGNPLVTGALLAGQTYLFTYNGTAWSYSYTNYDITNSPNLSNSPTGNSLTTLSSLLVQASAAAPSTREFLVNIGFTSAVGNGASGDTGDKVALYAGMVGNSGTGHIWAFNPLVVLSASSGTYDAQCIEADTNNNNADTGNTSGSGGLAAPVVYGVSVTGVSGFKCTGAILIAGNISGTLPMWNRGITLANNSVVQFGIQDFNACTSFAQALGTYSITLDLAAASATTSSIDIPNGSGMRALRNSSSSRDNLIGYTSSNTVILGNAQGAIFAQNIVQPQTDNTFTLGGASNRWSTVYAATGTINTSDPAQKTNIQPLPDALPIIAAINPITFQWLSGGYDLVDTTETQTVHQHIEVEEDEERLILVNGAMHSTQVKATTLKPVWDDIPVLDPATGLPLTVTIPAQAEIMDATGKIVQAAVPERTVPRTHRVPHLAEQQVTVKKPVSRAGKRVHWGFDALNVQAALAASGRDFAGYVKMEDGTSALRPDQLVPILWKAVQEQQAMIVSLQADVAALKAHTGGTP